MTIKSIGSNLGKILDSIINILTAGLQNLIILQFEGKKKNSPIINLPGKVFFNIFQNYNALF